MEINIMQIVIVDDDKNFVKAVEKTLKDFFKNRKETTKIISFESSTLINLHYINLHLFV